MPFAHAGSKSGRLLFALSLPLLIVQPLPAGGGPENVVVVVNRDSWSSLTVANHYVQLRAIPRSHVIFLDKVPGEDRISVEAFRVQILRPILKAISLRGLDSQIDCIAYSSGFPTAISLRGDVGDQKLSKVATVSPLPAPPPVSVFGKKYPS